MARDTARARARAWGCGSAIHAGVTKTPPSPEFRVKLCVSPSHALHCRHANIDSSRRCSCVCVSVVVVNTPNTRACAFAHTHTSRTHACVSLVLSARSRAIFWTSSCLRLRSCVFVLWRTRTSRSYYLTCTQAQEGQERPTVSRVEAPGKPVHGGRSLSPIPLLIARSAEEPRGSACVVLLACRISDKVVCACLELRAGHDEGGRSDGL